MIETIDDLSPDQLASLTGEQITAIEENPDKIDEILNTQASKDKERDSQAASEQEVDTSAANGTDKEDGNTEESDPVLLNKSEKGTIPYSTLQNTRKDLAAERQRSAELEQQLADERAAREEAISKHTELAKAQENASTPAEAKQAQEDLDAHLKTLEEDFPEQAALIKSVMDENSKITKDLGSLSEKLEKLENTSPTGETKEQMEQRLREEAIEAVDNNPDLAYWRDNDSDAFDEADKQDQILRNDPKWKGKTFDERFVEAVRRTKAIMPDASKAPKLAGGKLTDADRKAQAKKKVDGARIPEPTTLTDIGGAEGASLSKVEEMDSMDPLDLTAKLLRMSPEDAAAYRAEGDI